MPKGPFVTAAIVGLLGLVLAAGGLYLIALGGSWYYALAGAGLIASGALMWRGAAWGARLYWLVLALTLAWALIEVGFSPWELVPRLAGPALIGLWLAMPWVRRKLDFPPSKAPAARWRRFAPAGLGLLLILAGVLALPRAPAATAPPASAAAEAGAADWPHPSRTLSGARFSPAAQINTQNVGRLEEAWRHHTGRARGTYQTTPILADGQLVFCNAANIVIAVDPDSGEELWRHDPETETEGRMILACRGVSHASGLAASGACASRIYTATVDARLIALDSKTGAPCPGFGENGAVDLMAGMGEHPPGFYYVTSPPLVTQGLVVLGGFVLDNQTTRAPSGVIRAFDARTGALAWAWDMGAPERRGAPPAGETYTLGTANAWSLFSADPDLGLIYAPLGNPSPDFWGGARRDYDDLYGSAVVALDVRTGRPAWSFQTTHHDVWDYDIPAQPVLADIPAPEGARPAVIVGTKRGEVFILDRRTGAPLFPVEERPVPQGAAEGDRLAPTQPFSAVSLAPPPLTETDMWGLSPLDQMLCRIKFRQLRYEGTFTPPGLTPSLKYPGSFGVTEWGGVSVDEDNAILIANTSYVPSIDQLIPREQAPPFSQAISEARHYEWGPQEGAPFVIRTHLFLSRLRVPCVAPPWGRMNAIDLRTGRLLWSRPLGTARDSGPLDIPSHLPFEIGVPNTGGAIATRGGVAFVGAAVDRYLRAFDIRTGAELWRGRLPASGHAAPMTYISPKTGRQYVVIAAGGHLSLGPRLSDALVAFALPPEADSSP